jgi:hypothetical protein
MHTSVLGRFLAGQATIEELRSDLDGSRVSAGRDVTRYRVVDDLVEPLVVTAAHLVSLCDAVLAGDLSTGDLETVAFAIVASDGDFTWEANSEFGRRVDATIHDWSTPAINYSMDHGTVEKFRVRLLTGEDTFTPADLGRSVGGGRSTRTRRVPKR